MLGGSDVVGFAVNPANSAMPVQSVEFVTPNDLVNQDQQSQEFQATGVIGDFSYVGGLYYFHESIAESLHTIFGAVVSPDAAFLADGTNTYAVDSTSYAGYANLGYKPAFLDEKIPNCRPACATRRTNCPKIRKMFPAACSAVRFRIHTPGKISAGAHWAIRINGRLIS